MAVRNRHDDGLGHVYVMTNPAMPGLVKIGFTTKTPEERARSLSAPTGVPLPYEVAWATRRMRDFKEVERAAHRRLSDHRDERDGREFFRVPVKHAIRAVRADARAAARRRAGARLRRLLLLAALAGIAWLLWRSGLSVGMS